MKQIIKKYFRKISSGSLAPIFYHCWNAMTQLYIWILKGNWYLTAAPMPDAEQQRTIRENVTFIYKSFERQHMAKRLYHNIQKFYPGANVIIVDDSRKKLELQGPGLQIIQLPFNSGLSRGLNAALKQVDTPFTVRLDDDELLTPHSNFHGHLKYLIEHPEIDLVGILPWNIPRQIDWRKNADNYYKFSMSNSPRKLLIAHGTKIDDNHIVLGKVPNIFIIRSEKYKELGYDDNIRMIDHHEFFYRASGNIVSVLDLSSYVLHYHNPFHRFYHTYRMQYREDLIYIRAKYALTKKEN